MTLMCSPASGGKHGNDKTRFTLVDDLHLVALVQWVTAAVPPPPSLQRLCTEDRCQCASLHDDIGKK